MKIYIGPRLQKKGASGLGTAENESNHHNMAGKDHWIRETVRVVSEIAPRDDDCDVNIYSPSRAYSDAIVNNIPNDVQSRFRCIRPRPSKIECVRGDCAIYNVVVNPMGAWMDGNFWFGFFYPLTVGMRDRVTIFVERADSPLQWEEGDITIDLKTAENGHNCRFHLF